MIPDQPKFMPNGCVAVHSEGTYHPITGRPLTFVKVEDVVGAALLRGKAEWQDPPASKTRQAQDDEMFLCNTCGLEPLELADMAEAALHAMRAEPETAKMYLECIIGALRDCVGAGPIEEED